MGLDDRRFILRLAVTSSNRAAGLALLALLVGGPGVGCTDDPEGPVGGGGETADADSADGLSDTGDDGPDVGEAPDVPQICTPTAQVCLDLQTSGVCSEDGTEWASTTPCAPGEVCVGLGGVCYEPFCWPDSRSCENAFKWVQCDPTGSTFIDEGFCEEGFFCEDGDCTSCEPGERVCAGETAYKVCNDEGTAFGGAVACELGLYCTEGNCLKCEPGTIECVGDAAYHVCEDDGLAWEAIEDCPLDQTCVAGACVSCEVETQCVNDTTYEWRCLSEGGVVDTQLIPCQEDYFCSAGECFYAPCAPAVLFVVDRSGSMSGSWGSVQQAVDALLDDQPTLRFGVYGFPANGSCGVNSFADVPPGFNNKDAIDTWFTANGPNGSTPLYYAVEAVEDNAEALFGEFGGSVIVLSDGEDTCGGDLGPGGMPTALATLSGKLLVEHGVQTYVIGYNFSGNTSELDALASYGGTDYPEHIPASNASQLGEALDSIVGDIKTCN